MAASIRLGPGFVIARTSGATVTPPPTEARGVANITTLGLGGYPDHATIVPTAAATRTYSQLITTLGLWGGPDVPITAVTGGGVTGPWYVDTAEVFVPGAFIADLFSAGPVAAEVNV